jgi:hypothetical protein
VVEGADGQSRVFLQVPVPRPVGELHSSPTARLEGVSRGLVNAVARRVVMVARSVSEVSIFALILVEVCSPG